VLFPKRYVLFVHSSGVERKNSCADARRSTHFHFISAEQCLIIRIFQFVFFSAGTVFFSHNKSVRTVFSLFFQRSQRGEVDMIFFPAAVVDTFVGPGYQQQRRKKGTNRGNKSTQGFS